MDIQFWVWLIVIVITLIARSSKKKTGSFNPEQNQPPAPSSEDSKPVTFEDLLREIQAAKKPKPKTAPMVSSPKPKSTREVEVVDYDDYLPEEAKSLENTKQFYSDDKIYETYEAAKKAAFTRASLEETMKVEDTEVKFNKFNEFKKTAEPRLASEYASELRNPRSFKRALILSEILSKRF